MEKEIRIFDDTNRVLKVKGIRFDLLEVSSGVLIDTQNSGDLNPPGSGSSDDWGVKLSFSAKPGPLEVYTTDPNYRYPGNTIQSLEGQNDNRIDVDLLAVPVTSGGQATVLGTSDPTQVAEWVEASQWSRLEQRAVLNLVSNYIRLRTFREMAPKKDELSRILHDWENVLRNLKIDIE